MTDVRGDEILLYGDPRLRRVVANVAAFDGSLQLLADRLLRVQAQKRAVGLAANQIAVELNVFSVDEGLTRRGGSTEVLVNAVLIETEGEIIAEEGCLCFPEIFIEVARPRRIAIRAFDRHGHPIEREAEGTLARAYLHEIDHLQGRLFIDYVDPLTRRRVLDRMEALIARRRKVDDPGDRWKVL